MKFCGECGTPLNPACSACGAPNPDGFKFCGECGNSFAKEEETPDRGTPEVYTPKHLADKVLSQRSALEGEKKLVTIMFADVKGSMELADELGPEGWHNLLDRFFEILSEGVHRFEGTVNQYTGDGIMALFGAPIAHEDHARRACYAALHLQKTLNEFAQEQRRERGVNFSARIGINSGDVIVGKIGDDLRMDYTAQGHTVGLAQRMEQLAQPGSIYMTEHTAKIVDGFFELDDQGEFKVKGAEQPMPVFELRGTGSLRTRLELSKSKGFSTFVGRASEMSILDTALEHAIGGNGQVVGVVGEAGVGKSRVCFEFLESCREKNIPVYESHCPAHGQTIPYLPTLEFLRNFFGINEQDSPETARQKIAGTALLIDNTTNELLPTVFDFLDITDPNNPGPDMDPEGRVRQVLAFLRHVNRLRSEQTPCVLYIDDMHWVDPGSDRFFEQLVDTMDRNRTLMLLNFRPEYEPRWSHRPFYQQLPMVPLSADAIAEMILEFLGNDSSLSGLGQLIQGRTAGNPFFIEEVIQMLVETEKLTGSKGEYSLTAPIDSLEIPDSVRAILSARIDRLDQNAKHVLQAAAVVGKNFSEPILTSIVAIDESSMTGGLETLQKTEFIYSQSIYPVNEFSFKHPLTHEVALDTQLSDRRQAMHRAVARAIIADNPVRLEENAPLIAYHFTQAEEWEEAMEWNVRAADWASTRNVVSTAQFRWDAYHCGAHAPRVRRVDEIRLAQGVAAQSMGMWVLGFSIEELARRETELRELATDLDNVGFLRELVLGEIGSRPFVGYPKRYIEGMTENELDIDPNENLRGYLSLAGYHSWSCYSCGIFEQSLAIVDEIETFIGGDIGMGVKETGNSSAMWMKTTKGLIKAATGKIQDALKDFAEAAEIGEKVKIPQVISQLDGRYFMVKFLAGLSPEEAEKEEQFLAGQFEVAEKGESLYLAELYRAQWALALFVTGKIDDALVHATRALDALETIKVGRDIVPQVRTIIGWCLIEQNRLDEAEKELRTIFKHIESRGHLPFSTFGCIAMANAIMARDDFRDRLNDIESALVTAENLIEDRSEITTTPHVLECRARLAQKLGDDIKETELFMKALQGYQKTGALGHVKRLTEKTALS